MSDDCNEKYGPQSRQRQHLSLRRLLPRRCVSPFLHRDFIWRLRFQRLNQPFKNNCAPVMQKGGLVSVRRPTKTDRIGGPAFAPATVDTGARPAYTRATENG